MRKQDRFVRVQNDNLTSGGSVTAASRRPGDEKGREKGREKGGLEMEENSIWVHGGFLSRASLS